MRTIGLTLAALALSLCEGDEDGLAAVTGPGVERLARDLSLAIVRPAVDLDVETPFGAITAKPPGEALARFAPSLVEAFEGLPPVLTRRAGLGRVVLCSGLAFAGRPRSAVPDFARNVLYLDVERGGRRPDYQKFGILHEFFHMVDHRDDGELYRDDAWAALNPPGFSYGPGGANVQDDPMGALYTDRFPGFLTAYSTAGVEEDKAEVFSRMVLDPGEVARRAAADPIVARKAARMKGLLKAFEPTVDDVFWRRVEARRAKPAG